MTTTSAAAAPLALTVVPAALTDEDKKNGSVGVHHWKTAQAPAKVGLAIFMIALTDAYLKALSAAEGKALAARTHFAYGKTWVEGKESHISIHTASFADLTDPEYAESLKHNIESYVPFVLYLGPIWHHFGFLRQMLAACKVYPVLVPPRLAVNPAKGPYLVGGYVESGPYLFARDQYPGESEQSIAESEADGVCIVRAEPAEETKA